MASQKESAHAKMFSSIISTDPCFVALMGDLAVRREGGKVAADKPLARATETEGLEESGPEDDEDEVGSFHSVMEEFDDVILGLEEKEMTTIPRHPSEDPSVHPVSVARGRRRDRLLAVVAVARKALDWRRLSRLSRRQRRKGEQRGGAQADTAESKEAAEPTGLSKVVAELQLVEGKPALTAATEPKEQLGWPIVGAAKDALAVVAVDGEGLQASAAKPNRKGFVKRIMSSE